MTAATGDSHRHNNFDFLRVLLAAVVIFSHSYDLLGRENPFRRATGGQTELASVAVDLFFVLSGFLITQSFLQSRGVLDYLKKRVLRIFPAFVAGGLVCLLFFGPLPAGFSRGYWEWVELKPFTFRLFTLQTLWVQQTFKANHWPYVNSAVWTIQYEFVCYLVIAALGVLTILRRRSLVLGLFVMVLIINVVHHQMLYYLLERFPTVSLFNYAEWPVGGSPAYCPRFLTYFLAGSVVYLYRERIAFTLPRALIAATALGLALFIYPLYDAVMPLAGTYLVLWFAFNPAIPLQRFGRRGDFSYGLYVYGWPVQQTIIYLMHQKIAPLPLFLLALLGAFGCAWASWYCVERPFLRLKSHRPHAAAPVDVHVAAMVDGAPAKSVSVS